MKNIAVSACLLGVPCRYDGRSKPCEKVIALKEKYNVIPICPETLGGLPTPRVPAEITGNKVVRRDGIDVTTEYQKGAASALDICKENAVCAAVLKERSPACGKGAVYDGNFNGTLTVGNGVAANKLIENGIAVFGESEIDEMLKII